MGEDIIRKAERQHQEETRRIPSGESMHMQDSPIKMSGTMPPAMKQALKEVRAERQAKSTEQVKQPEHTSFARPTGSASFEALMERLSPVSFVYEEVLLPSRGRFYDGNDGPTNGIVSIRPMTGDEEQILTTPRWTQNGQAIDMIFSRCIKESHKYKTENFLTKDREFLLIWLRGISFGTKYEVDIKCQECPKHFSYEINLDLNKIECPSTFGPPLSGTLPKSGFRFSYRFPRGRDDMKIQEYRSKHINQFKESTDESSMFRLALLLEDIEGITSKTELMILVKRLPIQDVNYLRAMINEPPFGVDTLINITCPHCYNSFQNELPMDIHFFFPRVHLDRTQA